MTKKPEGESPVLVTSRTSSFQHYMSLAERRPKFGNRRSNSCKYSRSEPPSAPSRGTVQYSTSQSRTAQHGSSIGMASRATRNLGRSYSLLDSSASSDPATRLSSGSANMKSLGRPPKVRRWGRVVSDWDGLRRVGNEEKTFWITSNLSAGSRAMV